jgi:trk system potassium uptake protein TrkA
LSDEPFASRVRQALTGRGRRSDVLVVGLGRFGSTLAIELEALGHHVLGVDSHEEIVQRFRDRLTDVVQADTTSEDVLRQLGVAEFETAVVAIGTSVEDSVLTAVALVDLGVPNLWARAISTAHASILQRVGVENVVQPDRDEALRVAHRVMSGKMMSFLGLDETFALVEVAAPTELVGRSLEAAGVRRRYGVTVVCIKPVGGSFTYATPETVVGEGDLLVVAGPTAVAERFALLPGPSKPNGRSFLPDGT